MNSSPEPVSGLGVAGPQDPEHVPAASYALEPSAVRSLTDRIVSSTGEAAPTYCPFNGQVLARIDNIKPDDASSGTQRRYIVGTSWDLSTRTSVTFDVQSLSPRNGLSGTASRTYFLHFIANY